MTVCTVQLHAWARSVFSEVNSSCCLRELAAKRRDALLLYEFSRDAAGLPIPGTQRRFKLTANPRQIGQESVGLGVYLTTIILYMGIMLLLALLSVYLIVDNSKQAGYTETYTAFVNNVSMHFLLAPVVICASVGLHWQQQHTG